MFSFYLAVKYIKAILFYFSLFLAFSSMVEGKNRISTDKVYGGARIHYIFQSIFVKSLEVSSSFKYLASLHMPSEDVVLNHYVRRGYQF
jgi:hypothetical protein